MTDILMPALSPTMEEGVLAKWHVKVGDTVKAGDVIAEIETDKATMEVEAVDEGEITDILVAEGSEGVKVNTPIARLKDEGGAAAPAPKAETASPPRSRLRLGRGTAKRWRGRWLQARSSSRATEQRTPPLHRLRRSPSPFHGEETRSQPSGPERPRRPRP